MNVLRFEDCFESELCIVSHCEVPVCDSIQSVKGRHLFGGDGSNLRDAGFEVKAGAVLNGFYAKGILDDGIRFLSRNRKCEPHGTGFRCFGIVEIGKADLQPEHSVISRNRDILSVIDLGDFIIAGDHIEAFDQYAAFILSLKLSDPALVQQIQRVIRDGSDVGMEVVFDHELSKLLIVVDVGCNHHIVQTISHVDETLDRQKLVGVHITEPLVEERLIDNELLVGESIQALGKVVQFLHGGGVEPEVLEIGKRIEAEKADLLIGHILSAGDSRSLLGVSDLLGCGGKIQHSVEGFPSEPVLRGKLNSDFVSHRQLPHYFILFIDCFDSLPDSRNDRHRYTVAGHLVQVAVLQSKGCRLIKLFVGISLQTPALNGHEFSDSASVQDSVPVLSGDRKHRLVRLLDPAALLTHLFSVGREDRSRRILN